MNNNKICNTCNTAKPLADYQVSPKTQRLFINCRACRKKATANKQDTTVTSYQASVLRVLVGNGLKKHQVAGRLGEVSGKTLDILLERGFLTRDTEGYYELSTKGRAACPARNPHFAMRLKARAAQKSNQAIRGTTHVD